MLVDIHTFSRFNRGSAPPAPWQREPPSSSDRRMWGDQSRAAHTPILGHTVRAYRPTTAVVSRPLTHEKQYTNGCIVTESQSSGCDAVINAWTAVWCAKTATPWRSSSSHSLPFCSLEKLLGLDKPIKPYRTYLYRNKVLVITKVTTQDTPKLVSKELCHRLYRNLKLPTNIVRQSTATSQFNCWKKEHLHTFPWLIMSKIENKSIGICFILYSIVVIESTLSSCVVSSTLISKQWQWKPHNAQISKQNRPSPYSFRWIVSKIENKSLQIHTLLLIVATCLLIIFSFSTRP
jgi:hypothetical protein